MLRSQHHGKNRGRVRTIRSVAVPAKDELTVYMKSIEGVVQEIHIGIRELSGGWLLYCAG
jgi:hypothetical protein